MSDPRRLHEEAPDSLEASLLGALRSEQPRAEARERVLRSLITAGVGVGVGTAVTLAAKTTAKASALAWPSAWTIAGLSTGTALTVSVLTVAILPTEGAERTIHAPHGSAHAAAPKPAPQPALAPPHATVEPQTTAVVEPAVSAKPATVNARVAKAPRAASAPNVRARALSAELAALSLIKRALDDGARDFALEQLTSYERAFPSGYLREEAQLLRVQALLAQGEPGRAADAARAMLVQNPAGPLAAKARALLEAAEQRIKK